MSDKQIDVFGKDAPNSTAQGSGNETQKQLKARQGSGFETQKQLKARQGSGFETEKQLRARQGSGFETEKQLRAQRAPFPVGKGGKTQPGQGAGVKKAKPGDRAKMLVAHRYRIRQPQGSRQSVPICGEPVQSREGTPEKPIDVSIYHLAKRVQGALQASPGNGR